jgi:DNA-binding transcriptional ArsR family regulator
LFNYLIKHRLDFIGILFCMAIHTEIEQRAKIFAALQSNEVSGSEVAQKLEISLALMCHHSKVIVDVGLAKKRKEGQTAYFSLDKEVLANCLKSLDRSPDSTRYK